MKIGIEFGKISCGGGERILRMLAKSFVEKGHSVVIFTWNHEWREEIIEFPHELCVLNNTPFWGGGIRSLRELSKEVKRTHVDCLLAFLSASLRIFIGAAKLSHIPVITSLRVEPVFDSLIKKVLKGMIWCCDGVVFQTETVRKAFFGKIYNNSIVIPNPIMDDNLPYTNLTLCNKEIIGIGRLTEQKNFALLIDAFAKVNPDDYILRIFGEGHLRDVLQKQINQYGMINKIVLEGHVERVADHIVNSDIFVLSSDWEGMPNALMESMAMGLACIATDVATGGCRDIINDGENGLLVPVNDEQALRIAICKLIDDNELKVKIKRNARSIRATHTKSLVVSKWLSFIEEKCIIKKSHSFAHQH